MPDVTAQEAGSQRGVTQSIIGLPMARSRPDNGPDTGVTSQSVPVGKMARDIYRRLCRRPKSPFDLSSDFGIVILVPAYHLLRLVFFTLRDNAAVRRQRGIPLYKQLAAQWRLMTVYGTDPSVYYSSQLYDRPGGVDDIVSYVGRDEIKNGLLRHLHWMRPKIYGARVSLGDKLAYTRHCEASGLPAPSVLYLADQGKWSWLPTGQQPFQMSGDPFDRDIFIKPRKGRGARGADWFDRIGAGLYRGKNGAVLRRAELLREILRRSRRGSIMILPKLANHPEIADLACNSLIVFRVFTCLDGDGRPVITHAMLRILSKLEPTWRGSSEYGVLVDLQSGILGQLCDDDHFAPDAWLDRHPVTGARVAGRRIANWPAIAALALTAHRSFIDRMMIGWDVALTPEGPMLIEGNAYPDTHFLQRVHRQLIGESPMAPLLHHHLQVLAHKAPRGPFLLRSHARNDNYLNY
ncbi:MAG: sugar-transfer associated ATP-grasp domain-containing protein [Dongiaceae bacterium]